MRTTDPLSTFKIELPRHAIFTVADIAIGLSIHRSHSTPIARPTYIHVDRYYSRLLERNGFRRYGRDGGP